MNEKKIGYYTELTRTYGNLAKSNGVEINDDVRNLIDDIANYTLQKEVISEEKAETIDKIKNQNEFQLYVKENCGDFYFNFYNRISDKLEPQYLTRFLYLCTYLDYSNRLVVKRGRTNVCIKESELGLILKLSQREVVYTKNALIDNEMIVINNDCISVNSKYCKKGDIMKNKSVEKTRMFEDYIQSLYLNSTAKEHKKLAMLFKLLPYINLRWNVICANPDEEIMDEIIPLTVKDLMPITGYTHSTRFKKALLDLTVEEELVITFSRNKNGEILLVNPKVYYKGVDINELKYLIGLFSMNRPIGN